MIGWSRNNCAPPRIARFRSSRSGTSSSLTRRRTESAACGEKKNPDGASGVDHTCQRTARRSRNRASSQRRRSLSRKRRAVFVFRHLGMYGRCAGKANPQPVELALERLGVTRAWMFGDTPDDMRAARAANVLPIGVSAPGEDTQPLQGTLTRAGAAPCLREFKTWPR